jgi:hypothetical protein
MRWVFIFLSIISLLVCLAACILWFKPVQHYQLGNSFVFHGNRYSLLLTSDRLAIFGPPPEAKDSASVKEIQDISKILRTSGGTLRYHGTTGGMGFGDWDIFGDPVGNPTFRRPRNAAIPLLLSSLEDPKYFLMAHAYLTLTEDGEEASGHPQWGIKFHIKETAWESGHWTGEYDGVSIHIDEDRPRGDCGSWGREIWAVTTSPEITPKQREEICRLWHDRLHALLGTVLYSRIAIWALGIHLATLAGLYQSRRRRLRKQMAGLCLVCGYDLRASPERCPECGTVVEDSRPLCANKANNRLEP